MRNLLLALALATTPTLVALPAPVAAQTSPLLDALGGLSWGMSTTEVVDWYRELYLDDYRTAIAGVNDPMEIDRLRQDTDRAVGRIAESLETFDETRTGYEVSVIQGEVAGNRGQAMLTVREAVLTRYFVFEGDRLIKVAVVYALEDIGYLGFEGFVERLEEMYGRPATSDWEEDDIGVRHLRRAQWDDGIARLRVEDRSAMFAAYVLVFGDATVPDAVVDSSAVRTATRPSGGRSLSDMVQRLQTDAPETETSADIVDQLTGADTSVTIVVPVDAEAVAVEGSGGADGDQSALDDDETITDGERRTRPTRTTPTEAEEETDEGVTIY